MPFINLCSNLSFINNKLHRGIRFIFQKVQQVYSDMEFILNTKTKHI